VEGGGPYTFDCDGPSVVALEANIEIDRDVVLDGEGNLTIQAAPAWSIFSVSEDVTVGLLRLAMTQGLGAVRNSGTVSMTSVTVSEVICGGKVCIDGAIRNYPGGTLTLTNSTVSRNEVGMFNEGAVTVTNTTISQGESVAIWNGGTMTLANSTVTGDIWLVSPWTAPGSMTLTHSLVAGNCVVDGFGDGDVFSKGYNIESPGNTCGFGGTDQVNVSADDLKLGPLQDNGGPTETHALLPGSVAIDQIPEGDCAVDADQRHVSRPRGDGCDVGAVEVDLACVGADIGSECAHPNFTGVCAADTCWATDCSELSDGINCLVPSGRDGPYPGRCAAGSCERETVFP
jgi:hypothetical protein